MHDPIFTRMYQSSHHWFFYIKLTNYFQTHNVDGHITMRENVEYCACYLGWLMYIMWLTEVSVTITCRQDIITLRLTTATLSNPHSLFYHESHDFSASLTVSRPYKLISRVVHFAVWTTIIAILMMRVTPISYLNIRKMCLGFGNSHQIMLTAERSRAACLWH